MFDSMTINMGGPQHVTKTVREHRAPTDESVALLKEMEEKAEQKFIHQLTLKMEDNLINASVFAEKDFTSGMGLTVKFLVVYRINGKGKQCRFYVDESKMALLNHYQRVKMVAEEAIQALSEDVAKHIVKEHLIVNFVGAVK